MNNGGWRVSVPVPRELVSVLGKTRLKRSLETHSQMEAERRKHSVLADFFKLIEDARRGQVEKVKAVLEASKTETRNDPVGLALRIREELVRVPEDSPLKDELLDGVSIIAEDLLGREIDFDPVTEEPVYDPLREAKADLFVKIATGKATPLREPLQRFYGEVSWSPRTKLDCDRALELLQSWCESEHVVFTVESITRKRAGQFIGALSANKERPLTNRTINKYLSCLSKYWQWLGARGLADDEKTPWKGQSLPKIKPKEDEEERPFTDDEVLRLLKGKPNQGYLKPLMLIGALTGARIDAVISLRRKDITEDGCIRFKAQKRERNSRLVPIHPDLRPVIDDLIKGKQSDDDLFPECPAVAEDKPQERSMPAVKAFGYYRKSIGVTDKVEGKRRDRINFHSFRRWFVTKALQAGQPELVVQLVVGHKPQSVTTSVYLGGLTQEQLRACVEAVKLPTALTSSESDCISK
ncbi:tyrosine-type recombinase/integrase [Rhizobium sp. FKL33]|uniref:tyrosine-type recombinase/integrase n=1 Tax=Rhizobium sp. FKL33 TaxID=2562307 RepID=UPI0032B2C0A8